MQSLSYGDVEASVFSTDNQDAYDYGTRCDEEFMQLGLRGVTILVASGDDGLGGTQLRDNYTLACSQGKFDWFNGLCLEQLRSIGKCNVFSLCHCP